MNTIQYLNGICGSGKTDSAIKESCRLASLGKEKIAFVVPSVELQQEYVTRIKEFCVIKKFKIPVYAINSGNVKTTSASADLRQHLETHNEGQILIITQSLFMLNVYWQFAREWSLYIDEEMELLLDLTLQCNDPRNLGSHDFVLSYFNELMKVDTSKPNYVHFKVKRDISWKELESWSKDDSIYYTFRGLNECATKKNYRIKTTHENWATFNDRSTKKLYLWATFNTSTFAQFKRVTIMGADIETSQMATILKGDGFKLISSRHNTGAKHDKLKVEINFASFRDTWSMSYYNQPYNDTKTNLDVYMALVHENNGSSSILVQNNKATTWPTQLKAVHLPYSAEGLNKPEYTNVHNYSECGAYNFTPERLAIMQLEKIADADKLQLRRIVNHVYQGFMRSSARMENKGNTTHKIFVPTETIANALKEKFFPNAVVKQMTTSNNEYREFLQRKESLTGAQLAVRSRMRKNIQSFFDDRTSGCPTITFSFFAKTSSKTPENTHSFSNFYEVSEFLSMMNRGYSVKHEALLFSNASMTGRTTEEVIAYNPMIVLDVDNSSVAPENVSAVLESHGLEHIVCASFNHGKDGVNKMRILLPLKDSAEDAMQYRELVQDAGTMLCNWIQESFNGATFIIDSSSEKITQMYYMPGIDKQNIDANFFFYKPGNAFSVIDSEVTEKVFVITKQSENILEPIKHRIAEVKPKHRNVPYCNIIGYIQHNRSQFDEVLLQQVYQMWVTVDPNRVKCGSYDRFRKTVGI